MGRALSVHRLGAVNLMTTNVHLGVTIPAGNWAIAGVDLSACLAASLFFLVAVKIRRKWTEVTA